MKKVSKVKLHDVIDSIQNKIKTKNSNKPKDPKKVK